jgi:NDP-sugar pyrophosphorylase family protein
MKAMVLAAGLGLRSRPLTLLRAKPVLPVLNRPLLHWTFEHLARHGVDDVVVNLHHLPDTVSEVLGDGRQFGVRLRYSREDKILGTAGGPRAVRDLFGSEPLLLVNGDMLFDFDLGRLVKRHRASGARATLALLPNPDVKRYGPVTTDVSGRVLSIAGMPRRARGTRSLFTGVHVLDPALLDRLPEGPSDSVRDLYIPLVAEGERLQGVRLRGAWYDLSRPSQYRDAQLRLVPGQGRDRVLLHPEAQVSPSARLRRSVVGPEARVGADALVQRSILWDRATVENGARVDGSVVVSGARVRADERARGVVVMPERALKNDDSAGGRVEHRDGMAWVELS